MIIDCHKVLDVCTIKKNKLIYNLLMVKPEKFNFFYEIVFDLGFELILWCSKNLFRLSC